MNGKQLILITASFPHGKGEAFLEAEIPYLSNVFDEIIICCPPSSEAQRNIPANCRIIYIQAEWKLKTAVFLKAIFQWETIREILFSWSKLQFKERLNGLKVIIKDMHDAFLYQSALKKQLPELQSSSKLFYTYWTDYKTLALSKLHQSKKIRTFVTRFHRWDLYNETHPIPYLPYRNFIAQKARKLFFISEHGKAYFQHNYKLVKENVAETARLGTKSSAIIQHISDPHELRIASVSALIPRKRVDLIFDTVAEIKAKNVHWFHFGDGPEKERIFSHQQLIKNPHIHFVGAVNNIELHEWYSRNRVDLFINVSSSEGVPVSIMEAFSYGIPVIATAVDGNPEIVTDGYNGFLLSANPSKEDVNQCIQRFIAMDNADKLSLSENARNTWQEKYNAEVNFSRFAAQLSALLD